MGHDNENCEQAEKCVMTQLETKQIRADLQTTIDLLKDASGSREISLAITKLQEGKMWLGMQLGNLSGQDLNAERDKQELKDLRCECEPKPDPSDSE